ncbi:general substrate transporter [Hypoxylon sp. FL1284]|nr:general substrate transporter [Hypoxylon sp. FL1284]
MSPDSSMATMPRQPPILDSDSLSASDTPPQSNTPSESGTQLGPPPPEPVGPSPPKRWISQRHGIVAFSSIAIALYGYDQGMMSLVNTNYSYLRTMGIPGDSAMVGVIVSVYYLGCLVGAIIASYLADKKGRKLSISVCLITTMVGNLLMFVCGLFPWESDDEWDGGSRALMILGRVVLGLGVGGIDAVIPVYSSEISKDGARGRALAKEFQANIGGLVLAFALNLGFTRWLGKDDQWAWRAPILAMQVFPWSLLLIIWSLPESPRWLVSKDRFTNARRVLVGLHGEAKADGFLEQLHNAQREETGEHIGYWDMVKPGGSQFHPTMVTIMGQVNQALTGYGAVSVYGPQIFQLLGWDVASSENMTLLNYLIYFGMMMVAWMTIDLLGRRKLMVWGSGGLATCFAFLTVMGGFALDFFQGPRLTIEVLGSVTLVISTAIFGICWLTTVWLIPTEIYPNRARAQGSAISVIIWGLANFAITFLTPLGFNNLRYWLFLVFTATNSFAGWWTWRFSPETGSRSFEENQEFFRLASQDGSWVVGRVGGGSFLRMPLKQQDRDAANAEDGEVAKGDPSETTALISRPGE